MADIDPNAPNPNPNPGSNPGPNPNSPTEQERAAIASAEAARNKASATANKDVKTPVKLLYDTWDSDGNRVAAGAVVELPIEAAKTLLREGKAERADPLPGEMTV